MAGIKITELIDGQLLQPSDVIPVARGTDTRGLKGSTFATTPQFENFQSTFITHYDELSTDQTIRFLELSADAMTIAKKWRDHQLHASDLPTEQEFAIKELSAAWQGAYTTVWAYSSDWLTVQSRIGKKWYDFELDVDDLPADERPSFRELSSTWQGAYTTVWAYSSDWLTVQSRIGKKWYDFELDVDDLPADERPTIKQLSSVWDSTHTTVWSNSSSWINVQSRIGKKWRDFELDVDDLSADERPTIKELSSVWDSTYTTVWLNSAHWNEPVDLAVRTLTGDWQSTYSTVSLNSAAVWNYQGTDLKSLSGNWENSYSTVWSKSAGWDAMFSSVGADLAVRTLTGNWQNSYTTIQSNSAETWSYQGTDLKTLSSSWTGGNSAFTTVWSKSANWDAAFGTAGADLAVRTLTADWQNSYTTVRSNSAIWSIDSSTDTPVRALTGRWESTYTNVQSNSANWRLEDFIVACSDETTSLNVSPSAVSFRVPFAMYLNSIRASVGTAPVGSTIIVDVKQNNVSVFSTLLTIDSNEETSVTALVPAVISNPNLIDNAKILISINQVGSTVPGKGLKLTFKGYRV